MRNESRSDDRGGLWRMENEDGNVKTREAKRGRVREKCQQLDVLIGDRDPTELF